MSYKEVRYFNANSFAIAIVGSFTPSVDWAVYIGADNGIRKEDETCKFVLKYGCKLSEHDARHFFPDVELPYRN